MRILSGVYKCKACIALLQMFNVIDVYSYALGVTDQTEAHPTHDSVTATFKCGHLLALLRSRPSPANNT